MGESSYYVAGEHTAEVIEHQEDSIDKDTTLTPANVLLVVLFLVGIAALAVLALFGREARRVQRAMRRPGGVTRTDAKRSGVGTVS